MWEESVCAYEVPYMQRIGGFHPLPVRTQEEMTNLLSGLITFGLYCELCKWSESLWESLSGDCSTGLNDLLYGQIQEEYEI